MFIQQHPRGTTIQSDEYTGDLSQITIDFERMEIRLHDGQTPGGFRILNLEQLLVEFMSKDSEFGQVTFEENEVGQLTRIGDREYVLRTMRPLETSDEDTALQIINPDGVDGDPLFEVNRTWFRKQLMAEQVSRLPYAGNTSGSATNFVINSADMANWVGNTGASFLCYFHTQPSPEGAVISVQGGPETVLYPVGGFWSEVTDENWRSLAWVIKIGDQYRVLNAHAGFGSGGDGGGDGGGGDGDGGGGTPDVVDTAGPLLSYGAFESQGQRSALTTADLPEMASGQSCLVVVKFATRVEFEGQDPDPTFANFRVTKLNDQYYIDLVDELRIRNEPEINGFSPGNRFRDGHFYQHVGSSFSFSMAWFRTLYDQQGGSFPTSSTLTVWRTPLGATI